MQGYSKSLICTFLGNSRNFGDWSAQFTGDAPHITFIENVDTSETFYRTIIQLVLKQIVNTIRYIQLFELFTLFDGHLQHSNIKQTST